MNATTSSDKREADGLVQPHSLSGVTELSTITEAAKFMSSHLVGAAGVYSRDAHHLLGIVTERDITRAVAEGRDPDRSRVAELMSTDLVVAEAPVTLDEARARMKDAHVRHLVVRRDGGDHIVSLRDVVPAAAGHPGRTRGSSPESIRPGRHRPTIA